MQTTQINTPVYGAGDIQDVPTRRESPISWSAIFAGAFVTLVVTVLLMLFGAGLGLAAMPRASAAELTCIGAIWMIVVQWLSSAFGGYITGRLRTAWTGVHTHEVFFRDTAHGFLAWTMATLIGLGLAMTAAIPMTHHAMAYQRIVSGPANGGPEANGSHREAGPAVPNGGPLAYYVDSLYRAPVAAPTGSATGTTGNASRIDPDTRMETSRILAKDLVGNTIPDNDRVYLTDQVVAHTGLSQSDAMKRVDDVYTQAKADEAKAQKAAAAFAFYTFLSMLVGAFIACAAAALGGHLRDDNVYGPGSARLV
jgi:hypothetical protein